MNVTFNGALSKQAAPQTVTIIITKPDNQTTTLTTTTKDDKTFTKTTILPAGIYSAVAHVDSDGTYDAADSPPASFTVTLEDRTISLLVG